MSSYSSISLFQHALSFECFILETMFLFCFFVFNQLLVSSTFSKNFFQNLH
jgi:hypothetical protein